MIAILAMLFGAPADVMAKDGRAHLERLVRLQHEKIWSEGRLDLIPQVFTEDYRGHFPGGLLEGHEGVRQQVISFRQAFPDWKESVLDIIVEGDRVVSQFASGGTHLGTFAGQAASGNTIDITEVVIHRFEDGRIAEQWVYPDMLAMQSQLQADSSTSAPAIEHLNSGQVLPEGLPFSEAVRVGDVLYLSGQIGIIPGSLKLIPGGIREQARQAMENIRATLRAHGYSMQDVVKCTVMMADMAQWPSFNEVYVEFFDKPYPARSAFGSSGLALGARVEVECIAAH